MARSFDPNSIVALPRLGAADGVALATAPFVKNLEQAHKEYGDALGVTSAKAPPPPPTGVRDKLDAFAGAVRNYTLKVAAHADEPKLQSVAAELLAPLTTWISRAAKASP